MVTTLDATQAAEIDSHVIDDARVLPRPQNGAAPVDTLKDNTLKLTIDIDQLTLGDLELFDKFSDGNTKAVELLDFLQRIVVGTDIRTLPLSKMNDVMAAVSEAISAATNPGN